MLRRRVAVPALLGLLGLVWAGVHALLSGPGVAAPGGGQGEAVERYLAYLPTSLALCLTLALVLAAGAALGRRRLDTSARSIWLFGVVPVLGFVLDTLIELPARGEATASGTAVAIAELAPVFLIGLLLQIPFALVAVGLATRLLWLAEDLAWALRAPGAAAPQPAPAVVRGDAATRARALHLAGSSRCRAPPALPAA